MLFLVVEHLQTLASVGLHHVLAVFGDGFDPGIYVPDKPPEGSEGLTNVAKIIIGWLMIVGVMASVAVGMTMLGLGWWNKRGRQYNVKEAVWAFVIAALISVVGSVLSLVSGFTDIILSAFG